MPNGERSLSRRNTPAVGLILAAALFGAGCAGSSSRAGPPKPLLTTLPPATAATTAATTAVPPAGAAACAPSRPFRPGPSAQTFAFQGVNRTYQLYVPASYDGTAKVSVVFNFHGFGSNSTAEMIYADFRPLADAHNFIIVAPDGQGSAQHFNLTGEPLLQDDIAFTVALLDHVQTAFCVDPRRVFSTGMSDGGAMTSVLACREPDRFAAFGAVAVVVHVPGCVARPVPIMAFSGTADPVVPFNGGKVNCCGSPILGAAPDAMAGWAAQDNCSAGPKDTRLGTQVRLREWSGCGPRAAVEFYIIDGGGHTWPGSAIALPALGLTTTQIKATDLIWAFFQAHPLT